MRDNQSSRSSRSIPLPREHGSWAMFAVPLIIGLAMAGTWQWRSVWLLRWAMGYGSIAAICGGWLVVLDRLHGLIGFGAIGAVLHISTNLIAEGTIVGERFIRGAPFLAPLLFANMGMLGLIVLLDPAERRR